MLLLLFGNVETFLCYSAFLLSQAALETRWCEFLKQTRQKYRIACAGVIYHPRRGSSGQVASVHRAFEMSEAYDFDR